MPTTSASGCLTGIKTCELPAPVGSLEGEEAVAGAKVHQPQGPGLVTRLHHLLQDGPHRLFKKLSSQKARRLPSPSEMLPRPVGVPCTVGELRPSARITLRSHCGSVALAGPHRAATSPQTWPHGSGTERVAPLCDCVSCMPLQPQTARRIFAPEEKRS